MIAVLEFVDGFGHDTEVVGIFPTLEVAKNYYTHNFLYQEFDFGRVEFDLYEAKEAYPTRKNKKGKNKK